MKNSFKPAWILTCFLTATSLAGAQTPDVLKVIPANADGFGVVKNLGDLNKKTGALGMRVGAPPIDLLDTASKMTGLGEGIDRNGSAGAIVYFQPGEFPPVAIVVALPVANFDTVLKSVNAKDAGDGLHTFQAPTGADILIAKKGNFALIADESFRPALLKTLKAAESAAEKTKAIERWLASQDVAAVVLEAAVKQHAKKLLEHIPDQLPGVPAEQENVIKGQLELVRKFVKAASEEVTHLAVGASIDAGENLKVAYQLGFIKTGTFAKWAAGQPTEHPLASLPKSPYVFAVGSTLAAESMGSLMGFSVESSKTLYQLSDADAKELEKAWLSTMKGVRSMALAFQLPKDGGESFLADTIGVMRVDDSKSYLETYREGLDKSNKIMKLQSASKAVKVGAFDGVETEMDMKLLLQGKNDPGAEKVFEKIFGTSNKMTTTVVAVDPKTILLGYVPAPKMKKLADAYAQRQMLMTDPLSAKTLKLLPKNAFFVALWSPKETLGLVARFGKAFDREIPLPPIGETPPVGVAVRSDAASFELNIAVPADVFNEIGQLMKNLRRE
jgi:hypothetical protein